MTVEEEMHALISAIPVRSKEEPAEWCAKNVKLPRSTDSAFYRPEFTPWWSEPMNEAAKSRNNEICITAPIGAGKSTFAECVVCRRVDQRPDPTLIVGQTDPDIQDWAEEGLFPALRSCEAIAAKVNQGKFRKAEALLPGMPINLTGANLSGLQSKSRVLVIADEAWMYKPGMRDQLRGRTHRRHNAMVILMGQAGYLKKDEDEAILEPEWWWQQPVTGDDFAEAAAHGEQREWCFACPQCGDVQPYKLEQMQIPEDGNLAQRAAGAVYECANCKAAWADTSKDRRLLANNSRYETLREAIQPGHIHFHLNFLALWRAPWALGVQKWLHAKEQNDKGLSLPLEIFTQKELAVPWDEELSINLPDIEESQLNTKDFSQGEEVEGEVRRFATVDVGADHFWLRVRAWRADGSSLGLYYSKINTESTLAEIIAKYNVPPQHVLVDSGYDTPAIYEMCAARKWRAIKGDGSHVDGYNHKTRNGTERRLYSPVRVVTTKTGSKARLIHLAVEPLKDILAKLRRGQGVAWDTVAGTNPDWHKQIDSEVKEEFVKGKSQQTSMQWVKKKKHNHSLDCEVYQIAAALIWGVL